MPALLPTNPEVVVVGAGFAGLAASRVLTRAGVAHVVIEAAARAGGRCVADLSLGLPVDLGAAWMHAADQNPLTAIAAAHGLRTVAEKNAPRWLFHGGRAASADETAAFEAAFAALSARVEAAAEGARDVAVAKLATARDWTDRLANALYGPLEAGLELDALSAADFGSIIFTGDERYVMPAFGLLPPRLAEGLPVRFGASAEAVDWSGAGVTVATSVGRIAARAAIVTVSVGVLASGALHFTPTLPDAHLSALHGLTMGVLNKAILRFAPGSLGAEDNCTVTQLRNDGRVADAIVNYDGQPLAVCFAGGDEALALERAGEAATLDFHLAMLTDVFGSAIRNQLVGHVLTRWGANPLTCGAYSSARVGRHQARAALALPVGERLWFAGEASGGIFATEAPGAWESGGAAARAILMKLSSSR